MIIKNGVGSNPTLSIKKKGYMRHSNYKTEKEKEIRRLWNQYLELSDAKRHNGTWIDVEPYQRGWVRTYDLRDDIKNRNDAPEVREVLKIINSTLFCRNKEFTRLRSKKKEEPIPQPLLRITPEKYNELNEKCQSFFVKRELVEHYISRNITVTRYEFKNDFWFVFVIEPNIITRHWLPDGEIESRYAELTHRFNRDNLWPKLNKVLGVSSHPYLDMRWVQNKYGQSFTDDDLDYDVPEGG